MRKLISFAIILCFGLTAFSQAVKDRNVVPVAVTLNQVLRMTITNGGNIEFVFNTIDDYKLGLSADQAISASANPANSEPMYKTDFTVAASTRWELTYGAEEATFIGTDNPTNTLDLDNVGFDLANNGLNLFNLPAVVGPAGVNPEALISLPTANGTEVSALQPYPVPLITDSGSNTVSNAGDAADNSFTLNWRCGTIEAGAVNPMNPVSLINQNPSPAADRYVVNVLFELQAL